MSTYDTVWYQCQYLTIRAVSFFYLVIGYLLLFVMDIGYLLFYNGGSTYYDIGIVFHHGIYLGLRFFRIGPFLSVSGIARSWEEGDA